MARVYAMCVHIRSWNLIDLLLAAWYSGMYVSLCIFVWECGLENSWISNHHVCLCVYLHYLVELWEAAYKKGVLAVCMHTWAIHGPPQSHDNFILGHGVLVLVDLFLYQTMLSINTLNSGWRRSKIWGNSHHPAKNVTTWAAARVMVSVMCMSKCLLIMKKMKRQTNMVSRGMQDWETQNGAAAICRCVWDSAPIAFSVGIKKCPNGFWLVTTCDALTAT